MKITYDKKADAIYIKLGNETSYDKTRKVTDNFLVDYSADGKVLGIEVLDASNNVILPINKESIPLETVS